MGVFKDLFKNFNLSNLLGDLGSSALGALGALFGQHSQYKYNKRLQDHAQEFNSAEASKNRAWQTLMNRENNQFNAAQAELARQFQEDFYLKYQSPSAMMSQYRDAGLNPVLAAGQATNTPPSASSASAGSAPSGSAASSGMNSVSPINLIESIAGMMKLKAEIDNIKADTEGKKQGVFESISRENLNNAYAELSKEQQNEVIQSANLKAAQASTESAKKEWYIAQKAFQIASQKQIDLQNAVSDAFKDVTGVDAPADMISSIIGKCIEVLGELPQTFFKFARKSKTTSKVKGGK